jgi:CHRD domain
MTVPVVANVLRLTHQISQQESRHMHRRKGLTAAIVGVSDPNSWYVNLHTPDFPDGAIRGQLKAGG